ncbi:MAG: hypothetical protein HDQ99_16470 [Lachnospiraceae bacterium]|nr:hypothetical protein [Lachnospiraceae bacterium]
MRMTSAEAAKLLRKLNEELDNVLLMEQQSREFSAALGEDVESVRPVYDYAQVQKQIEELENRIRQVKHAVSSFNLAQEVPGFEGMTIDQMLVYIPQLNRRKAKLGLMQQRLPKQRERVSYGGGSQIIDYSYANYDLEAVRADYEKVSEELSRAQTALDLVNTTAQLEIPV